MPSDAVLEPQSQPSADAPEETTGMRVSGVKMTPLRCLVVIALLLATVPAMKWAAASASKAANFPTKIGLKELPKTVGLEHNGTDMELDKVSLTELDPDEYLWRIYARTYSDGGQAYEIPMDFMVIYGHKKQTFHEPGYCLPGGGWLIDEKSASKAGRDGLPLSMGRFLIRRDVKGQVLKQVVLYAFVQGDRATPSLIVHNKNLLSARMRHDRPTGAFVRVIVPVVLTEEDADARGREFMREIYPELRKRLG